MKADKNFYKIFFSIAIVLVCQNVITLSVNLADNIMLGGSSETALSGVAAVNQLQFVFQQLVGALGDGLVIIGSQYWGKRQIEPMKIIAAVAMRSAVIVGLVLFMIVSVFPNQTMALFTTDSKIIKEGIRYLNVIRFSYLFFCSYTDFICYVTEYRSGTYCLLAVCSDVGSKLWDKLYFNLW